MNHRWPPKEQWNVLASQDARDGNEHHIRSCLLCSMIKITIITPFRFDAWHEWITKDGLVWTGEATPPCAPREPQEVKAL